VSDTDTKENKEKKGWFARFSLFIREVIAELRKVIWPTRNELITYTGVVIVFVLIMAGIIFGYDWFFGRLVLFVFGGGGTEEVPIPEGG